MKYGLCADLKGVLEDEGRCRRLNPVVGVPSVMTVATRSHLLDIEGGLIRLGSFDDRHDTFWVPTMSGPSDV